MRCATPLAALAWPSVAMAALFGSLFAGTPPAGLGMRDGALAPRPDVARRPEV